MDYHIKSILKRTNLATIAALFARGIVPQDILLHCFPMPTDMYFKISHISNVSHQSYVSRMSMFRMLSPCVFYVILFKIWMNTFVNQYSTYIGNNSYKGGSIILIRQDITNFWAFECKQPCVYICLFVNDAHWDIAVFQCSSVFSRIITSSTGISGGSICSSCSSFRDDVTKHIDNKVQWCSCILNAMSFNVFTHMCSSHTLQCFSVSFKFVFAIIYFIM